MAITFILPSPSLFFYIPLARCESHLRKVTIACCGFCTALHHELPDYSLGQIAFAVLQALFVVLFQY